jgi:hypothetical protein
VEQFHSYCKEYDQLQIEERDILEKVKMTEEKIICISRRNMQLPRSLYVAQRSNLKALLKKQIHKHNISEPRAGFQAFFEGNSKERFHINEDKKTKEDNRNRKYKWQICSNLGIEEKFDPIGALHILRKKNRELMTQVDNDKRDFLNMKNEIKKMKESLGD